MNIPSISEEELQSNIRASIREVLAILGDLEVQRKYERDVPIADIPAELFCMWFDDSYVPESTAHQKAFTARELEALERFNTLFDTLGVTLREVSPLSELQARGEWVRISEAAAETLKQIPETLPNAHPCP